MESLLVTVSVFLLTWLMIITGFVGTGMLIQRIYGIKKIDTDKILVSFWAGFAFMICTGQIWNFFLPAGGRLWLVIMVTAITGFISLRKQLKFWFVRLSKNWGRLTTFVILILIIATEVAFKSAHSVPVHDTGSYHLPATLWSHAYPIVPGLSNLHSRLGFNSSLFVYAASLSEGVWANRPHHVVMGPLILMFYIMAFIGIKRIFFNKGSVRFQDFLAATYIVPVYFFYHSFHYAASIAPNGVIILLILIGAWLTIAGENLPGKPKQYLLFVSSLVLLMAITIKLTIAPYAVSVLILVAWWSFRKQNTLTGTSRFKTLLWMIISGFLLIAPWLARSVVLSGYPLYPFTEGEINVDWRVPEIQAQLDAAWTRSYSRGCFDGPPKGFEWVIPWVKGQLGGIYHMQGLLLPILLLTGAIIIILLFLVYKRKHTFSYINKSVLWITGLALFGIVVWFLTAPDIRFGIGLFWLLASVWTAVSLTLIIKQCSCVILKRITLGIIIGTLVFLFIIKFSELLIKFPDSKYSIWSSEGENDFEELINKGLSPLPVIDMWQFTTNSGLRINVPVKGNQVWNAPLLSTPHPSPGLSLRDAGDLSKGFKSEGQWNPYGYPILIYPWKNYVKKRLKEYYGKEGKSDSEK